MKTLGALALAATTLAVPAGAVELTGGAVELGYSAFTEETDVNRTILRGQAELGFTRNFAAQVDAGYYGYHYLGDGVNLTAHGIYHGSETASFGVYVGYDEIESVSATTYGLEAGMLLAPSVIAEVYAGGFDIEGEGGLMMGVEVANAFGNGLSARAGIDHVNSDFGVDVTSIELGLDYKVTPQTGLYAEVGSTRLSGFGASGSETYVGAGVTIDFGAKRGATFGYRSLFDLIPGL